MFGLYVNAFVLIVCLTSSISGLATPKEFIYHGKIAEDAKEGDDVHLDVPISVKNWNKLTGDEICGYTLYQRHDEQPFRVDLQDGETGRARVVLDTGYSLDYEKKHKYNLEIAAYDCLTGSHADRERIHIKVEDVNEFAPAWEQSVFTGSIEEGKVSEDGIVQLKTTDADESKMNSKICQYRILTPEVPFKIDENGYLFNTEPLNYESRKQYSLDIMAEDCGGRTSEKASVDIDVKAKCKPRWTDYDNNVDVIGPLMKQTLMPETNLDLCNTTCDPQRITVDIALDTSHIAKGCDRDVYSIQAHRKLCGGAGAAIELLPRPSAANSWTRGMPTDGTNDVNAVFNFDGKSTAIDVPLEGLGPITSNRFTLSTWMKHEKNEDDPNPHGTKEQILCSADGDGMNRHHFGLYVHNCRLVMLMRQEPVSGDMYTESLSPAEWRWTLSEVCDGKWHHFALAVELPQIRLYVDGKLFQESSNNPEVLDDWPLHTSTEVHFMKLTVGACWQGGKNRMGYHFHGELTGLALVKNQTDSDHVMQCLTSCQEKLDLAELEDMDTGMSVSMNTEMNVITIIGLTLDSVERLLRNVAYINYRLSPTAGPRTVSVKTQVQCANENDKVQIKDVTLELMVYETEQIIITLSGTTLISREEENFEKGEYILKDLIIMAATKSDNFESEENEMVMKDATELHASYLIDSCAVDSDLKIDLINEHFVFPVDVVKQLGLDVAATERGFIIAGADKILTYQNLLRQVQYVNSKAKDFNHRLLTLTCTEMNQHLISNPLLINLEMIHRAPEKLAPPPHAKIMVNKAEHQIMTDNQRMLSNAFPNSIKYDSQETGIGVAVVMVVCVGFVLMLIVLGIIRVRNSQRNAEQEEGEKGNWDSSPLTITVNPMDPDNAYEEEEDNGVPCHDDETDSDDDDVMYRDDRLEASSGGSHSRQLHGRHLKWDRTTLAL